jgi:hypothetical protein
MWPRGGFVLLSTLHIGDLGYDFTSDTAMIRRHFATTDRMGWDGVYMVLYI